MDTLEMLAYLYEEDIIDDNLNIKDEASKLSGGIPLIVVGDNYYLAGFGSDGTEIISEVFADMSTDNPSEFSHKFYNKVLEIIGGVKK